MNLLFIATRIAKSPVKINHLDWYPGNPVSDGDFGVDADTPHGRLKGEGLIGPDEGVFEDEWKLDSKILPHKDSPSIHMPGGKDSEKVKKEWVENMYQEVQKELQEWSDLYV